VRKQFVVSLPNKISDSFLYLSAAFANLHMAFFHIPLCTFSKTINLNMFFSFPISSVYISPRCFQNLTTVFQFECFAGFLQNLRASFALGRGEKLLLCCAV
jgi:hypothetical protein